MSETSTVTYPYVITGKHKNKTILRKQRMLNRYFDHLAVHNKGILELWTTYPRLRNGPSTAYEAQLPQSIMDTYWHLVRAACDLVHYILQIERSTPEIVLQVGYEQYGTGQFSTHWPSRIR